MGLIVDIFAGMGLAFFPLIFMMCFVVSLVMTRVTVSDRMEKREADVMNAIDLIVPEVQNGIKNAIVSYLDNFAPSVHDDFQAFITNIQDRGYTFEDAMYILADNLGMVFQDFAQKAIYFEAVGEREMVEIFADITETNRLRRQLRDENNNAFVTLRATFLISVGMVVGYFFFLMFTDSFSRQFFLTETAGKFLLLAIVGIIFAVLSYITTIKSRTI
jgi:Flp pilus assembly protein TadB